MAKKNKQVYNNKKRKRNNNDSSDDENDNKIKKSKQNKQINDQKSNIDSMSKQSTHTNSFIKCFWINNEENIMDLAQLKLLRQSIGVNVKGNIDNCPPPIDSIQSNSLPIVFKSIFDHLGLSSPSLAQRQCWPAILNGANVLCIATTGSGKTLAYAMPMIPHINNRMKTSKCKVFDTAAPFGLVLVPTRELAIQVNSVMKSLKKYSKINSIAIYGGEDKDKQLDQLSNAAGVQLIVATPGRLIDLIANKNISLKYITYLVIDEADRMLALGFREQITAISNQIDRNRQTMLFSATFPGKLREIVNDWLIEAVTIRCNTIDLSTNQDNNTSTSNVIINDEINDTIPPNDDLNNGHTSSDDKTTSIPIHSSLYTVSSTVEQHVHVCSTHKKPRLLIRHLDNIFEQERISNNRDTNLIIIFCNKIKTIQYLIKFLNKQKIKNPNKSKNYLNFSILHSKLSQNQREETLRQFSTGKVKILLTTDIISRGIHIKQLKHVINYDFPSNIESYCHRIGRVGRQGKLGYSYSLFTKNYCNLLHDLINLLQSNNQKIEPNLMQLYNEFNSGSNSINSIDHEDNDIDNDEEDDKLEDGNDDIENDLIDE